MAAPSDKRTPEFVFAEYEKTWGPVLEFVRERIASGETNIQRLINATQERVVRGTTEHRKKVFESTKKARDSDGYFFDGALIRENKCDAETSSIILEILRVRQVVKACGADTKRIIELGSGWARPLLRVWSFGGPADAEYVAAEINPVGREITALLGQVKGAPLVTTRHFDYYAADFSDLAAVPTVAFSSYSVEQIPHLTRSMMEAIAAIPGLTACLHFEPIGWQMEPSHEPFDTRHRELAMRRDINQNLYSLLREMERDGSIAIDACVKNFVGVTTANPASFIQWHPRRGET